MSKQIEEMMALVDTLISKSIGGGLCSIATHPDVAKQAQDYAKAIGILKSSIEAKLRELMPGWQPIKSAPKDGTRVMLYCPKAGQYEAFWEAEWVCYVDCLSEPTHWIPLTKAPE